MVSAPEELLIQQQIQPRRGRRGALGPATLPQLASSQHTGRGDHDPEASQGERQSRLPAARAEGTDTAHSDSPGTGAAQPRTPPSASSVTAHASYPRAQHAIQKQVSERLTCGTSASSSCLQTLQHGLEERRVTVKENCIQQLRIHIKRRTANSPRLRAGC